MAEHTMVGALNAALRDALTADPRTLVFGEDVGALGGVFRVTEGLQAEFGRERVFDTPIAEAGIAGICVGLAMAGWRPVAEMQFDGFSYPALDQVISHLAKYRERTRPGRGARRDPHPVVRRHPGQGASRREPRDLLRAHRRAEGRGAVDAARRLSVAAALDRGPGPRDLPRAEEPLLVQGGRRPDRGGTRHRTGEGRAGGGACVLIAYGAMVGRCLEAADALAHDGIEAAVLDLRSLVPLDVEAIGDAVRSTGRAVVVHEAPLTLGMAAEIVARIVEEAFDRLEAPVVRVTGPDVPYPPASLEQRYLPSVERISNAVRTVVAY